MRSVARDDYGASLKTGNSLIMKKINTKDVLKSVRRVLNVKRLCEDDRNVVGMAGGMVSKIREMGARSSNQINKLLRSKLKIFKKRNKVF